jgi:hypothetical protein
MCPLCFSSVAIAVAGVLSGGGVAAIAVKSFSSSLKRSNQPAGNKEK